MTPLVSICMVCRDRWELTRQALESLIATVPNTIPILVIDDASERRGEELIRWVNKFDIPTGPSITVIINDGEPMGVGGAKNYVIDKAWKNCKYLFSCDNDIRFKPGWLETLIGAYEAAGGEYKLLGGYAHPFNGTNHRHIYCDITRDYEIHEKNAVDGLSWFMEWETWHKYGPLDSHARGVRQSEDWAFCQKIRNDGFKVGVVYPHVIENHGVVDTFGERIPGAELVEKELQQ